MDNHYFDANGGYTYSLPAGEGLCPPDASRAPLPPTPWPVGFWPHFNRNTLTWALAPKELS